MKWFTKFKKLLSWHKHKKELLHKYYNGVHNGQQIVLDLTSIFGAGNEPDINKIKKLLNENDYWEAR